MAKVHVPGQYIEPNFAKRLKNWIYGKKTPGECVLYTIVFIIFSLVAFSYVYMVYWCFISGLKTSRDALLEPMVVHWDTLRFKNYLDVFTFLKAGKVSVWQMLGNSLFFAIGGQAISQYFMCTTAYVCVRYKFPGHRWLYFISFFQMIIPLYGSGGSAYTLNYKLGLINSYARILLNVGVVGLGYMYYDSFFQNMSSTYFEAADIDGANDIQKMLLLGIPLSMSLISALFIMGWVTVWNDYSGVLLYMPKIPTFAGGIYLFQEDMKYGARADILYASCFIACVPPILLYSLCSKMLLSNVSLGGIKE